MQSLSEEYQLQMLEIQYVRIHCDEESVCFELYHKQIKIRIIGAGVSLFKILLLINGC